RTAFDLVNGPLIRAQLVRLTANEHALVLTAHHIICDGWSFNVIVGEFAEIYGALCRGEALQLTTPMPFSSFAHSQNRRNAADLARDEAYWLGEYAEPARLLDLPTDRARPELK